MWFAVTLDNTKTVLQSCILLWGAPALCLLWQPAEGGELCLVDEAEMEIDGSPVMRVCEFPELYQGNS